MLSVLGSSGKLPDRVVGKLMAVLVLLWSVRCSWIYIYIFNVSRALVSSAAPVLQQSEKVN